MSNHTYLTSLYKAEDVSESTHQLSFVTLFSQNLGNPVRYCYLCIH